MAEDLAKMIRDLMRASNLSLHELERRSGVSHGILSRFLRGERTLTMPLTQKLADALGIEFMRPPTIPESAPKRRKP